VVAQLQFWAAFTPLSSRASPKIYMPCFALLKTLLVLLLRDLMTFIHSTLAGKNFHYTFLRTILLHTIRKYLTKNGQKQSSKIERNKFLKENFTFWIAKLI
jgi:hypothetical protein